MLLEHLFYQSLPLKRTLCNFQVSSDARLDHMQITTALAPENQPDYTQLNNGTYLMQSFEKLINDLENPIGVRPCIHSIHALLPAQCCSICYGAFWYSKLLCAILTDQACLVEA